MRSVLTTLAVIGLVGTASASFEWSAWSQCSADCGTDGTQYRTRCKRNCGFDRCLGPGPCREEELQDCNRGCPNGGIPDGSKCICLPGFTGKCCETAMTCPPPDAPEHGLYFGGNGYGDEITYECYQHYELVGDKTRTCDGVSWSGSDPYCEFVCPCQHGGNCTSDDDNFTCDCEDDYTGVDCDDAVLCDPPPSITHGSYTPPPNINGQQYIYGSNVYYQCDQYYQIEGSSVLNCGSYDNDTQGEWNSPPPSCNFACPCAHNGTCTSMNVNFTCDCTISWTGDLCQTIIECAAPPNISYGGYYPAPNANDYTYGTVINYYCDTGYVLNGDKTQTCLHDPNDYSEGAFNGTQPTCSFVCPCRNGGTCMPNDASYTCFCAPGFSGSLCGVAQQCVPPSSPAFGGVLPPPNNSTGTYDIDTVIHYVCDENYIVTGNINAACLVNPADPTGNGYWCGEGSTCTFVCPCVNGGNCTEQNNNYQCVCDSGFYGSLCQNLVTCVPPGDIQNGYYSPDSENGTDYQYHATITYSCNQYYTLVGQPTSMCDQNTQNSSEGIWTNSQPACFFVCPCSNGGSCSSQDSSFQCQCLPGWSGPLCQQLQYCQPAEDIPYGSFSPGPDMSNGNYTPGSVITYTCDEYYTISGEDSRTCQPSGNWSGSAPTCTFVCPCERGGVCSQPDSSFVCVCNPGDYGPLCLDLVTCLPPDPVKHGSYLPGPDVNGEYSYLTTIQYFCDANYGLTGEAQSTCQLANNDTSTGEWSGTQPSCSCVTACGGMLDDNYPSCLGCQFYVQCAGGQMTQLPCADGENYDPDLKRCTAFATCP